MLFREQREHIRTAGDSKLARAYTIHAAATTTATATAGHDVWLPSSGTNQQEIKAGTLRHVPPDSQAERRLEARYGHVPRTHEGCVPPSQASQW